MKRTDTREKIVHAAMELFAVKGYNSTSIADLLSRTQANSGSLYHYFPGKQDVLVAVLEYYRHNIDEMLLNHIWREGDDPIDKIFALLNAYRTLLLESECTYGCPIGSIALELHEPDLKVRELLAANFTVWTDAVAGCLKEAADHLPVDTDHRALAEHVLTTMEGAVMQARTYRDIGYFDRSIGQLRAHFHMLTGSARKLELQRI